jgi:hypothetical protein
MRRGALSALLLVLTACSAEPRPAGGTAEQIAALHAGCQGAMLRSTCRVLNDKSDLPPSEVVLIAGVGRVDARSYRALREAGDGMCAQVQVTCGSDWEAAPCRTARALWGTPAMKPR